MTLHRAFVSTNLLESVTVGSVIQLPNDVEHRFVKVLRLKADEEIELFDGHGSRVRGNIISAGTPKLRVSSIIHEKATRVKLTLAQAWVKQDKLEEIVQHCTELGVHKFVFFEATHSKVKLTDRTQNQVERLQRIATDASRQCERSDVPKLIGPLALAELVAHLNQPESTLFMGEPRESTRLFDTLKAIKVDEIREVVLIIGPEGGLSDLEISELKKIEALAVNYAPYVLRTQTAGLVGMSIIQSFM